MIVCPARDSSVDLCAPAFDGAGVDVGAELKLGQGEIFVAGVGLRDAARTADNQVLQFSEFTAIGSVTNGLCRVASRHFTHRLNGW